MRTTTTTTTAAAVTLCLALTSASAHADDNDWHTRVAFYAYVPSTTGTTQLEAAGNPSIDVTADELVDMTDLAGMASFEVQRGRWGAFTDLVYMNIADAVHATNAVAFGSVPLPPGVTANASYDVKAWLWTTALEYRAFETSATSIDVVAGARMLDAAVEASVTLNVPLPLPKGPVQSASASGSTRLWDAIAGFKGEVRLGAEQRWFVPFYADVGVGDSDLTWQAATGLGYHTSWGELFATWRYLSYDFDRESRLQDLQFSGPAVGFAVRFD